MSLSSYVAVSVYTPLLLPDSPFAASVSLSLSPSIALLVSLLLNLYPEAAKRSGFAVSVSLSLSIALLVSLLLNLILIYLILMYITLTTLSCLSRKRLI